MKIYIADTAHPLLHRVAETIKLQEELLTNEEKSRYPLWSRIFTSVNEFFITNRMPVNSLDLAQVNGGYSLTVNGDQVSFLVAGKEHSNA